MKKARSTAEILRKVGCDKLDLVKGDGYWYFVYDDVPANVFETCSVYVCYLSQLPLDTWVADGLEFVKTVQKGN